MSEEREAHGPQPVSDAGARGARFRRNLALIVFGGGAAYFLVTEHWAHTVQALPWLIVLLCPLVHVFMHRGHGGHESHHEGRGSGGGTR